MDGKGLSEITVSFNYDLISRRDAPRNAHGNGKSKYSPVQKKIVLKNKLQKQDYNLN